MQPPHQSSTISAPAGAAWGGALHVVALGVAAACLVLLRQTEFGPGLTPDSAAYISTARSLYAGEGFVPFSGGYAYWPGGYAYWPPLFPLILAATGVFHDDMIAAAAVVNAVAFGLTVFAVAAWLRRYQVSPLLVAWAGLGLALSPAAGVAAYVWSESVFVLFVVAALSALDRFLAAGTRKALLVSAGFAALCCLTRYAGASVLVCGVALIATCATLAPRRRIRAAVFYAVIGLAPVAVWLVRNLLVLGSPLGDRSQYDEQFSAPATVRMMVDAALNGTVGPAVLDWIGVFAPAVDGGTAYLLAWLLAVWGLVGWALARWRREGFGVAVAGGFVFCHLAFLAVASPLGGLNAEARFMAPLNAPMLVVLALTFHAGRARAWSATAEWDGKRAVWRRRLVRSAMVAAPALWLVQWVAPNVAEIKQWAESGGDGYGARRWAESETLAHLQSTAVDGPLLSNDPFAVYLLTGGGAAHRSGNRRIGNLGRLEKDIPPGTHVVWFHAPRVRRSTDLKALRAAFPNMRVLAAHADGVVFQQGEREDADAAGAAPRRISPPGLPVRR